MLPFQSTPPVRRATPGYSGPFRAPCCFNPRPPCGGRRPASGPCSARSRAFQSTPPVRRATSGPRRYASPSSPGFNPRPPCGGRPADDMFRPIVSGVSIHAPRAEGDRRRRIWAGGRPGFNPRPPCGGRRARRRCLLAGCGGVSIHAPRAEGDSDARASLCRAPHGFNPRPPCGGRQERAGPFRKLRNATFQSTPPVRRATSETVVRLPGERRHVSIHAPRAEGDPVAFGLPRSDASGGFNPRPPCGGRRRRSGTLARAARPCFNPRPPCGGRHTAFGLQIRDPDVSIHAPRAEGDLVSTTSVSGRERNVSIHAPRAEGDNFVCDLIELRVLRVSIHAPRAEGDVEAMVHIIKRLRFQSTPPVRRATTRPQETVGGYNGFNPRPPCGGRLPNCRFPGTGRLFQSTPPVRRATLTPSRRRFGASWRFQSTPPVRRATRRRRTRTAECVGFNPRPPCGGRLRPSLRR